MNEYIIDVYLTDDDDHNDGDVDDNHRNDDNE